MSDESRWHKVFETGIVPDGTTEKEAKGMAYFGWGMCFAGNEPPENFGKGMAELTILFPSVGDITQEL